MDLSRLDVGPDWTLFLDRDGVINRKLEGAYVRNWDEYEFLPGVKGALETLAAIFSKVIVVTNQQGVGKGLMSEAQLAEVHEKMTAAISQSGGRIDGVYYCPHLASDDCECRKPRTGMISNALRDFPEIEVERSVMVGDSGHDMDLGKRCGMYTVGVGPKLIAGARYMDAYVTDLAEFARRVGPRPGSHS